MTQEFSGLLREQVIWQQQAAGQVADGALNGAWWVRAQLWAAVTPAGTGAQAEGAVLSAMPRFHVLLRWREDIEVGDRLAWRGRKLLILNITQDYNQRDRMTIFAEQMR
jgi:head-tail adaptor